jgi:hypothetical protein
MEKSVGVAPVPVPQLEINRRLLGSSAIAYQNPNEKDIRIRLDLEGFVQRLLLFDTYILYSVRLKEIPELVRHFGYQGTLQLLSSGALEIRCECAQFGEGQFSTPPYPLLTFQFHVIESHNRDQYVIDNLREINRTPGLSARELMELKSAVMKVVKQPDNRKMFSTDVAPAFESDVLHNEHLLKDAVRFVLAKDQSTTIDEDFDLRFEKIAEDRYRTETNLDKKLTLSPEDLHSVIKGAILAVSSIDLRIGEMKAHTALSGFTDRELPLFRSKLASIADALNSSSQEREFTRVAAIAGLPQVTKDSRVDIENILRIRNEPEALEFRAWLAGVGKLSDSEIKDQVSSFNAKLGLTAQKTSGKVIRVLVQTGAGLVPGLGPFLGPTMSALDQFAWDKFARRSGIAAFINELYPSIFVTE